MGAKPITVQYANTTQSSVEFEMSVVFERLPLGVLNLMQYCADRSEYDITNLSRGTLMSCVDRSAQRCRKSNTPRLLQYNETLNWRMTADATPPPAGVCSSAESDKDIYITQLIHRLETLHMSTVVSTQQVSLQASIPNAQEPTTCCSQTKSSEVVKQLNTTQLRMLSHRWHSLGLQPPILKSKQEQVSDHHKSETRPPVENIQVTLVVSSRDDRTDETKGMSDSHCSSSDTCNRGPLDGNVNEQCSLNNSNRMSVECEDSDLSDLEKDNIPISKWTTPVKLDLRPDSSERHLELTETGEEEQVYPEVLPVLLETQQKLHVSDPCFTPMVARLLELEKFQAATIQREQGKAVRSRPTTAIIQNANRPRQMESPSSQVRTKGNNSVSADLTKLTLSSCSRSRSRQRTCPLSKSEVRQPSILHKKANSSAVKLRKTVAYAHNTSNSLPKCKSPNSFKCTNKHMPKLNETNIPTESVCGKT
ncbi:uncharacterized protein [Misgurnus anguillicaudatus]|uniref:uncharacterized protein isoform X1 n=2 Tax=Misgurnus anguillicaudatus TaxID=75329 RepID=UPI003CCFC7F3